MADRTPGTVLVTGATRGIGRAVAEDLLQRGYRVVGSARSPECWSADRFLYIPADICDEAGVRSLMREIQRQFDDFYGVVNMAGLGPIMNHALLVPGDTLSRFLEQNAVGTFLVNREAIKVLRRHNRGRIVNVSTISVPLSLSGEASYVASKGAVESLSQVLAKEVAGMGITVNVVGPTPILTDALADVPRDKLDDLVATLPVPRLGRFEDVTNVVAFFLRPESDGITGQIVYLGGVPNV